MSEPLYKQLKDKVARTWFNYVWLMAHRYKYGWSQLFSGMPGSGKTMTACKYAELLSKPGGFDPEKHVAFTPDEYLESLRNIEIGQPVVWSEMGIGLPARRWYTLSNMLVAEVIQTMRIKKPIVLMDVSDISFIDIQARKLIFCISTSMRWQENPVKLWINRISVDRKTGNIYFPHPLLKVDGHIVKLEYIRFDNKPSEEVWKVVDKKQRRFKKEIEVRARRTHRLLLKDLGMKRKTIYDMIEEVRENREKYIAKEGKVKDKLDWHLVMVDKGISRDKAISIIRYIESKDKA